MSIASVEREMWRELQEVTGNRKIRLKDFLEWCSVKREVGPGEKQVFLPKMRVWATYFDRR